MPAKTAEADPWDILCVDMIGPYSIQHAVQKKLTLELWAVTMIDPATGWFEIAQVDNKESHTVAETIEQTWLCRYPWPTTVILDRGTEFMGEFKRMIKEDYGIKARPITARNLQANSIVERVHQTIGQMLRTHQIQHSENIVNPFKGVLAAICFAVHATTLHASPTQLVFGRDHIMNIKYEADWQHIKYLKQKMIDKNNKLENKKRKVYEYQVGQKVLIKTEQLHKFGVNPYKGPYEIIFINNNGSYRLKTLQGRGAVFQTYNIRNMFPYQE